MKSFTLPVLDEPFRRGLRLDERERKNLLYLTACNLHKPGPWGLTKTPDFSLPFSAGQLSSAGVTVTSGDWPHPQLFKGREVTLLVDQTALYTVNLSTFDLTAVATFDVDNPGNSKGFDAGTNQWQFVDYGKAWLLYNGVEVVFQSFAHSLTGSPIADKVYVDDTYVPKCGAQVRGQYVVGGTTDSHHLWGVLSLNSVVWGQANGGDVFLPHFSGADLTFLESKAFGGEPNVNAEYLKRGGAGFTLLPFQGNILAIVEHGPHFIVYGDEGIASFRAGRVAAGEAGIRTFGIAEVLEVGLAGRGSVANNGSDLVPEHTFLDSEGYVWRIDNSLLFRRIGYREFGSTLTADNPKVSYDKMEKDFYLSDSASCFVLTPEGLGKADNAVTSIERFHKSGSPDTYAMAYALADADIITTSVFDMGMAGLKHIQGIELGSEGFTNHDPPPVYAEVRIEYRLADGGAFTNGTWVEFNSVGFATPIASGKEFRISLRGLTAAETAGGRIEWLKVHYQTEDKRMTRGLDVRQISA